VKPQLNQNYKKLQQAME